MSLFLDTSALYPLLVETDEGHEEVAEAFRRALEEGRTLVTTNYVVLETTALLQARIGLPAVADLERRILPLVRVRWVDASRHRRGVDELLRLDRRHLSLVDVLSFQEMEAEGIREALAQDRDFAERGFELFG